MKRFGNLWDKVIDGENLYKAYLKARKGKQCRAEVALFSFNLEKEILNLRNRLRNRTYIPGKYRLFTIYERKPREIAAAPFRDRVVHHAILNIIEPLIDKRFIGASYACRKGKGVHAAVAQYQKWSAQYQYCLKMDISRYFPTVDHDVLKQEINRHIKDPDLIALLALIINCAPTSHVPWQYFPEDDLLTPLSRRRGLPIGNLTSQFFANLYLNRFDHFVKENLQIKGYLRYVDDMFFLSNSKEYLWQVADSVERNLDALRLRLHPHKKYLFQTTHGVDVLGYRIFPQFRRLRNDNGHRFIRKLKRYAKGYQAGLLDWDDFNPSVQSWIGHSCMADTRGLRQKIFKDIVFVRGSSHRTEVPNE